VAESEATDTASKSFAGVARRRSECDGADTFNDTVFIQEIEPGSRVEGIAQEGQSESQWDSSVGSCDCEGQGLS